MLRLSFKGGGGLGADVFDKKNLIYQRKYLALPLGESRPWSTLQSLRIDAVKILLQIDKSKLLF